MVSFKQYLNEAAKIIDLEPEDETKKHYSDQLQRLNAAEQKAETERLKREHEDGLAALAQAEKDAKKQARQQKLNAIGSWAKASKKGAANGRKIGTIAGAVSGAVAGTIIGGIGTGVALAGYHSAQYARSKVPDVAYHAGKATSRVSRSIAQWRQSLANRKTKDK